MNDVVEPRSLISSREHLISLGVCSLNIQHRVVHLKLGVVAGFFSFSFVFSYRKGGECETESLEDEGFEHKGIVLGWSFPLSVFTIKDDIFAR